MQYAALYQAFTDLQIGGGPTDDHRSNRIHPLLMAEARNAYERLKSADEKEIRTWVKPVVDEIMADNKSRMDREIDSYFKERKTKLTPAQHAKVFAELSEAERKDMNTEYVEKLLEARKAFVAKIDQSSDSAADLEQFVASPAGDDEELIAELVRRNTDLVRLRESLVSEGAEHAKGWIHTPMVVVSWNQGVAGTYVGGHNLDAKISVFEPRPDNPREPLNLPKRRVEQTASSSTPLIAIGWWK